MSTCNSSKIIFTFIVIMEDGKAIMPVRFQLEENGDFYMIGSEIGVYMNMLRGSLYKKYPALWRRNATFDERQKIAVYNKNYATTMASNVTLVRTSEIDEILSGNHQKYKINPQIFINAAKNVDNFKNNDLNVKQTIENKVSLNEESFTTSMNNDLFNTLYDHTKSVSLLSPVINCHFSQKNLRSYPLLYNDYDLTVVRDITEHEVAYVPIHLALKINKYVLNDVFLWNKNDRLLTPVIFAEILCDDLKLPQNLFVQQIVNSIENQLLLDAMKESDYKDFDKNIIIKMDVIVNNQHYTDQFEWNLSNSLNDIRIFVEKLCAELFISGEFKSTIMYSFCAQVLWGRYASSSTENSFNSLSSPSSLPIRNIQFLNDWQPKVLSLSDQQLVILSNSV